MVERTTKGIAVEMKGDVFKIFLRPKPDHPLAQVQLQQIFEALKTGKVLYIPSNLEIIVLRNDGSVKVY